MICLSHTHSFYPYIAANSLQSTNDSLCFSAVIVLKSASAALAGLNWSNRVHSHIIPYHASTHSHTETHVRLTSLISFEETVISYSCDNRSNALYQKQFLAFCGKKIITFHIEFVLLPCLLLSSFLKNMHHGTVQR